ncbi:RES domain-containing protein [Hymenobacter tibetensis]|uniref:RES domain-containing protein n=1 Tax=Hymenobacter tibetensis TaxID=497967 RepID=A0ABY4CZX1_9BACT|nr:RES domain-containing protein [Hymenobacter tibetensis]UOG75828.1 RES domain-containing protein [Hymenobacter tibetensis]
MSVPPPQATEATIRRQLRRLRHLSCRRHSISSLSTRVRWLLTEPNIRCLELPAGTLVYRGIPCQELPQRVQDVSYPPPERIAHDQRANRAGVPMFYASATWHPPFFEAGVQPQDEIIISRWISRQPLRLVSFHPADQSPDDPHSDRDHTLRQVLQQLPSSVRVVSAFLTRIFTRPVSEENAHHYRFSIAIAEACKLGDFFDGLLYPSAAMPSLNHNLALHPSCLDTGKLELQYVEHLRVNKVGTETLDVCSLDFANQVAPDGRLHWLGQPGNWVLREGGKNTSCTL